ncbi:filamentous hemagglutinin [Caballeronia mineralivorans PML1(12)]|uniref:Filamentous hemagglutinin n=1 Tax=Caballeronia mineralivorans PML1(12) TaxID=908627 RepID=A0A0J1CWD8_9BURK|nr:filamentous hemagglutinin [Caballeronia mineralivorans PML1(12)]
MCQAVALVIGAVAAGNAQAGAINLGHVTAQTAGGGGAAGVPGMPSLGVSPQQALQASQPSIRNLGRAAQGIAAQLAAQQAAAAAAAATSSNVPNGLAAGGLQVAPGVSFDSNGVPTSATSNPANPVLWINANGPTQSVDSSGHVNVGIVQTGQNSVLTWQTMNVGKQTTLNFDQSGGAQTNGANNWVVLNRIMDPSGAPSQILGNVKAQGSVYVINRNGILFGAGSQVNVHSLVASSLDFLNTTDFQTGNTTVTANLVQGPADIAASNQLFLGTQGGLAGLEAGQTQVISKVGNPNEVLGLGNQVNVNSASQYQAPGDITIAPGASISTQTTGTVSDGGFVLVAATNVNNGGNITATAGQVVLAAGVGVSLSPNPSNPQVLLPELSGQLVTGSGASQRDITPAGTLINTGIVQAARGNVNLLGSTVAQNGVVGVTTSVNTPGTITISTVDEYFANTPTGTAYSAFKNPISQGLGGANDTHRAGLLTFGPDSVTTVMADTDGQTATSAPGTTFTPGSITMTAGSVWFQGGSLIEAPGSQVSVAALTPSAALDATPPGDTAVPGRIYLDTGATIDVSGLANVELPISSTLVTVPRIGQNELADSPLLRNGFLFGLTNVVFDSTLTGTNANGLQWVGSPILNLAGYVSLIPRTVDQLLTNGGTITLAGNQVMTATGSSMNLNGGYVHYDGGTVNTTRLVDANGVVVPIGQANPNDTYVGVAGQFVESHPRWGITKTWFNPLLTGGVVEPDYIVGGNAGTLNLFATQAMVLDGDITAQAFGGSKQVQGNSQPVGGTFSLGSNPALTQGLNTSTSGESGLVILQDSAPQLGNLLPGFSIGTPLDMTAMSTLAGTDPNNILATTVVPVNTLNAGGFAKLNVTEDTQIGTGFVVAQGTQLKLQPGGSITLSGPLLTGNTVVGGSLIAPSGTVSISNGGNIAVSPNAQISVAGQWVNNDTQTTAGTTPGDSQFINGGAVTLSAGGSIDLQSGSVIDVSGGGEMLANGQLLMSNGIPAGKGGSLSLITYANHAGFPDQLPTDDHLTMDGTIRSFGFAGGGTLTLQVTGFQIGGDPASAPSWAMTLPTDFFAQQGFGNYVLNALFDATVAPGATVTLTQQNLIPDVPALQQASSGADLAAGNLTSVGTIDPYHRQATNLVITAGGYLAWARADQNHSQQPIRGYPGVTGGVTVEQGASIVGDAGANIGLGSPAQVTVLGSIVAPGGSITLSADNGGRYAQSGQYDGAEGTFTSASKSVWLGPDAVLDVAGVALTNPLAAPVRSGLTTFTPNTGKVLPGGSVTISDDSGYVVAQAGSRIDVSGTSANFDQLQANGGYASQPVWSDAGSITLAASSGLFFDGTLRAQPGGAQAQGGTLSIVPDATAVSNAVEVGGVTTSLPGATVLILQQSGNLVPVGLSPGQDILAVAGAPSYNSTTTLTTNQPTGVLQFAADRLSGSGIFTLVLGDSAVTTNTIVPVAFAGNVDLTLSQAVQIHTDRIVALSGDQVNTLKVGTTDQLGHAAIVTVGTLLNNELTAQAPTTIGSTVTINAPYVAIAGPAQAGLTPVAAASNATLNVNASFIDLENQVQLNNFGQANFTSSGDIRLSSTNASTTSIGTLVPGELFTPGNMTFSAADLYPSTGSTFILDAVGPTGSTNGQPAPTTITFQSNGASGVPLSAGGTLLIDATDIVQAGVVRAPSGSLVFGVGDPTSSTTKAQFNKLPLVATNSVSFANGSVTSVSNEGAVIPYGTTVDGVEWQFNPVVGGAQPDVTSPPSKFIGVNGSSVALNPGAKIDLSGGGNLQAEEWVAGTGGTRDVLSQYNASFAANPSGVAVPVNVGAGNVYAILPGAQSPVAAYDPVFAQTLQPSVNGNGTAGTSTLSSGVGQASLTDAIGQAVYLSGVPGLAAGVYTLLPGKYATLPGAFRVTVSNTTGAVAPGASQTLPDGTVVTAGYFANALGGSRSATPTLFNVQSGPVWQQYSQYTLTGANAFFPKLATSAGNVTPPLPVDGGQLVLAATNALTLGATLNTAAGTGGAPAEVDIASQDIQITGGGAAGGSAALPGYLQIGAGALDSLNAGSLLIGGTRTATTSGVTINPIANSVVVSNDAGSALTGPEILLVTKTDATGADANAVNGLRIDAGSVITATGSYPGAKDLPITIGQLANATTNALAISGDGALLRVSNGAPITVTRLDTTGTGLLTVGAGAALTGGQALTLDSSGNLKVDPSVTLSAKSITADGSAITFTNETGTAAANLPGFVIGSATLAQLGNAQQVTLRSTGAIGFVGDVNATFGNSVDLSAGTFTSDGGAVTLNAQQIAFTNETGAPALAGTSGSGTLTVNAKEIDLGTGSKTVSGFGAVTMNATGGIVGQNTGTFDFGALPVTLNAPVFVADTSSASTVTTSGVLSLNNAMGTALTLKPVGGAWSFAGGTINDNATISAPAGNVSLDATTGNLTIGNGATVSSAGVSKQFFDTTQYAPAGSITLTADTGTVDVQAGSTLDFSGASGGGAAGSLTLSAPQQVVNLNGALKGGAATGFAGGSFSLNTGGAANLDSLASTLTSGGVNESITIQTKAGNLTLSAGNTLTAHTVSLTADAGTGGQDPANGNVSVIGTINASGNAGGEIDLYGRNGVDVEGSLVAKGSSATQRGGTVNIGTTGSPDTVGGVVQLDPTYGYENMSKTGSGVITVGANALIDVSGGTAGGLSGGTVSFRAPVLHDHTVNVTIRPGATITGARAVNLEAYAVWSTTDPGSGPKHFDGIVDPAGWYGSNGNLVAGTFTVQSNASTPPTFTFAPDGTGGGTLTSSATGITTTVTQDQLENGDAAIGFGGLTSDFFTPASTAVNADHQLFYREQTTTNSDGSTTTTPGTLMGFVQHGLDGVANQFAGTSIINFHVVPGIELDNPSPAINNGNISILTNWNLGAGTSPTDLAFRFNGQAPDITFRAENNVKVNASLTDGFFQIANPTGSVATIPVPAGSYYNTAYAEFNSTLLGSGAPLSYYVPAHGYNLGITAPQNFTVTPANAQEVAQYEGQYNAYFQFLAHLIPVNGAEAAFLMASQFNSATPVAGQPAFSVAPPTATQAASDATLYLKYLADYGTVFNQLLTTFQNTGVPGHLSMLQPPPAVLGPLITTSTITNGTVATDNSPSPVAVAGNALPLLSASLAGGTSSSFRIVAGADVSSSNPLAVQAASLFSTSSGMPLAGGGSVTLDGYFGYSNANNPTGTNNLTLLAPTMIRTGTGSIDIAAGNSFALFDAEEAKKNPAQTVVPGVVYTAGMSATGAPAVGSTATIVAGNASQGNPDILVSPVVNPDSAGDITIRAQGNITGLENVIDTTGAVSGQASANIGQFWWQWMQITASPTASANSGSMSYVPLTRTSINFGAFDQGVMSVGGNVSVSAGGNISDLAVSLPTTWYMDSSNSPVTVGGGNLSVHAGGNILSGDYFVAKGTGTINAGGQIAPDFQYQGGPVATLLAMQDGVLNVSARQGADIGGVFDPSYVQSSTLLNTYHSYADGQGYSSTSAVNVSASTGDVVLGSLRSIALIGGGASSIQPGAVDLSSILPASVNLTAFTGGITVASSGELYPSASGSLNLIADQSINFSSLNGLASSVQGGEPVFGMLDEDPSSMPSPKNPHVDVPFADAGTLAAHAQSALHANDTAPARIYSLDGSIVNGILEPAGAGNAGFYDNLITLSIDKPALVQAGQDIVNLAFQGQNLRGADVTRIIAGRDIYDTPLARNQPVIPALQLGGPGTFDVEAGRNIGPLTSQANAFAALGPAYPVNTGVVTGIDAVGNANNPNLPHESANVQVLFGVGPGINDAAFISAYIDPASTVSGIPSATPALIAFMEQYDAGQVVDTGLAADKAAAQNSVGTLTAAVAWSQFKALPGYVQQLFAEQVLFSVLTAVGQDFNNPSSPFFSQYARGYQAINTLFPASLGYTANSLGGGVNGASQPVNTGNLDIRSTTIQTQQGGNVAILGPGGQALIGSTSAPPAIVNGGGQVVAGPGTQGILTLEKGDINIFTDQSVLLAQSRIFTEQGGNMTIWSSNGDINAGKGSKSVADTPAPNYVCDANHYCTVDARGEVSGAGIGILQTIPGAPTGDANLIAPRGTVDAGDAGIRVSGNLNVAALHVANVDNIQVQGKSTGIPVVQAVNTGALTAASSAASAASQMAQDIARNNASGVGQRRWTITVEVEGFGDAGGDEVRKKRKTDQVGYDSSSAVSILGFGDTIGQTQRSVLSKEEQQRLGKI